MCSDSESNQVVWTSRRRSEWVGVKRFGELLSETMDVTMRQVFGESTSELIYRVMERQVSLKREEIGEEIEAFHAYLKKLVGSEVAQIILANSLKGLCTELRREYEQIENYLSFLDELYETKFKLLMSLLEEKRSACN